MAHYVRLQGNNEQLHNLPQTGDHEIRGKTANKLGEDLYEVYAYADDEAIQAFQAAGIEVDIVVTEAERQANQDEFNQYFDEHKSGIS